MGSHQFKIGAFIITASTLLLTCSTHTPYAANAAPVSSITKEKKEVPEPAVEPEHYIQWKRFNFATLKEAAASKRCMVLFLDSYRCTDCTQLSAETFSDEHVAELINDSFYPIRVMDYEPAFWNAIQAFNIENIPAVVIAPLYEDPPGMLIMGFISSDELLEKLDEMYETACGKEMLAAAEIPVGISTALQHH